MILAVLNGDWSTSMVTLIATVTAALERNRGRYDRLAFARTHSPALWMNVAPSEWSVSVVGRAYAPLATWSGAVCLTLVPCYARVRRNRELEDRWLICTRFTYAHVGCCAHLSRREMDHRHRYNSRCKARNKSILGIAIYWWVVKTMSFMIFWRQMRIIIIIICSTIVLDCLNNLSNTLIIQFWVVFSQLNVQGVRNWLN